MERFEDYSEEIYKCTKCGLCQSVCPVYKQLKEDCAVSRGKFVILNGVLKKDIEFSKKVSSYLDLCLHCNACGEYCPSGINAEKIISAAKYVSFEKNGASLLKKLVISFFNSKILLSCSKLGLDLYRNFKIADIADFLNNKTFKIKPLKLLNKWTKINVKYKKLQAKKTNNLTIAYFPGCVNKYINPSLLNSMKIISEVNGINLKVLNTDCCGIPAKHIGDLKSFIKSAKTNLDKIPDDIDFLVTDCASCGSAWKMYEETLKDDYKKKAENIAKKAVNIYELLEKIELYVPKTTEKPIKVTYHDPCHMVRFENIRLAPRNIINKLNVEFVEMKDSDTCCGASGSFIATQHKLSTEISKVKAQNIIDTKAEIVLTSCTSCVSGLYNGLIEINSDTKVMQPLELLAQIYLEDENV